MEASNFPPQDPNQAPAPQTPAPEAPAATGPDPRDTAAAELRSELDKLQERQAELEAKLASGQLTAAPADEQLRERVAELRATFKDWPQEGGLEGVEAQPWDLRALGLPQPGVTRDFLPPGPNELSPIVIRHGRGLVTSGHAGQPVLELAQLLAALGYPSSISRGENNAFAFDDSVGAAVGSFKRDYHVLEDSSGLPTSHDPQGYVGPYVWEALLRATARKDPTALPLEDLLRLTHESVAAA